MKPTYPNKFFRAAKSRVNIDKKCFPEYFTTYVMFIVINNSLPDVLVFSGNQGTIGMVGLIPQQCRFLIIVYIIF